MDINDDKMISRNELAYLLQSIGVNDITSEDISTIMEQFGEGKPEKQIHVQDVEDLILRGAQKTAQQTWEWWINRFQEPFPCPESAPDVRCSFIDLDIFKKDGSSILRNYVAIPHKY